MTFPPLGNSNHVVSVSIDVPSNSQQDALFHYISYDYCCVDWDSLLDHLRDNVGIFLNSVLVLLLVNFVGGFMLELMHICHIVSIRSSPTHLYGFQLLLQLP